MLRAIERAAFTRVMIDLIKADMVIDSREVDLYRQLKKQFAISRNDELAAYGLTLAEAIAILKQMDKSEVESILSVCLDMTASDGICPREEAMLMMTIQFCLGEGMPKSDVISTKIEDAWFDQSQVLFIESYHNKEINFEITQNHRLISNELKICGLDFVYIPNIAHHYITTPFELLTDVVTMLKPSLSQEAITGLLTKIRLFKTDSFCIEQLHQKLEFDGLDRTPPALLMRVSQSRVGDRILTNFLRIELEPEKVLDTIRLLADTFVEYNGADRIEISHQRDEKGSFLYRGFYRQIFEILLLQKSVKCHIKLDFMKGRNGNLSIPELDITLSKMHRKEKALYLLFIHELMNDAEFDNEGNFKLGGGICFTSPSSRRDLEEYNKKMKLIQRKFARIYTALGGDSLAVPDITNDAIRRPMITGIKRAIEEHKKKIYDYERLLIKPPSRNSDDKTYRITAQPDLFIFTDYSGPKPVTASIYDSPLFKELAEYA